MITPSFGITATERVLPKLALDFTTAILDSRITFTRTTDATHPATYVNSSGVITAATNNQPRFDYDPVTLACKGLLIEESRTNTMLQSQLASGWTATLATLNINNATSPDGTLTAAKITEDSSNGAHYITSASVLGTVTSTTYTASVYLKPAGRNFAYLDLLIGGKDCYGTVDLTTGAFGTMTGGATWASSNAGNGWWRITATVTTVSTQAATFYAGTASAQNVYSYTGDGTSGIYIWGVQLETGAFPTSYIPTTTTALTRNADVATITGTNFSSWYNQSEGSFYAQSVCFGVSAVGGSSTVLSTHDGTTSNRMRLYRATTTSSTDIYYGIVAGGVSQFALMTTNALNSTLKQCCSYKSTGAAWSINAGNPQTNGAFTVPTVNQLQIGDNISLRELNGWIQKINYWPQQLTNAQVQAFSKG